MLSAFQHWIDLWGLEPDGAPFTTEYAASRLLPVRQAGLAAMLKLAASDDERRGAVVMAWWAGRGAAPVLAHEGDALLLVRAQGERQLATEPDTVAVGVLCEAVRALHASHADPPATPPLASLFSALFDSDVSRLERSAAVARELLQTPREMVVLHGDIHHFNVLDFGVDDWRVIDPWGFHGERAYDYANILRNPDLDRVLEPGRFDSGLSQIAASANLEPGRLLRWIYVHAGLAAAWELADGHDPSRSYAVLEMAEARL